MPHFTTSEAATIQAVATVVLVAVTVWYAFRTHQATKAAKAAAEHAERSAKAAEDSVKASVLPVMVVGQGRMQINDAKPEVNFRLSNVGNGLARDVVVTVVTSAGGDVKREPSMHVGSIAAGERSPVPPGVQEARASDHKLIFDVDVNEIEADPSDPDNPNLPWLAAYGLDQWALLIVFRDIVGNEHSTRWDAGIDGMVEYEAGET